MSSSSRYSYHHSRQRHHYCRQRCRCSSSFLRLHRQRRIIDRVCVQLRPHHHSRAPSIIPPLPPSCCSGENLPGSSGSKLASIETVLANNPASSSRPPPPPPPAAAPDRRHRPMRPRVRCEPSTAPIPRLHVDGPPGCVTSYRTGEGGEGHRCLSRHAPDLSREEGIEVLGYEPPPRRRRRLSVSPRLRRRRELRSRPRSGSNPHPTHKLAGRADDGPARERRR